jgi:hypothetical protein
MLGRKGHRGRALAITALALVASLALPLSAEATCKVYKHRAKLESDPFGTDLAYLNIQMRVCYNGRRVTKAGALDITPSFTNNALSTVKFEGVSPVPIREYRAWHGAKHGSIFVKAGGTFTQGVPKLPSSSRYLWASMQIFGDGGVRKDRQNG